jgi:hypothetical protein
MTQSEPPAFFALEDDAFVPAPIARSPWSAEMLHGRLLAGLFARAFEQQYADPAFLFSRLTVDLFRSPPMAPVQIHTTVARDGNRIRAFDGTMSCDGVEIARANTVALLKSEQPEGAVWTPPVWSVPGPEDLEAPSFPPQGNGGPARPQGFAPMWETRTITGRMGGAELLQKRCWIRESRPLVEGEALTSFVRVALAADYTNPWANSGNQGLQFINADITLYIQRLPEQEWIGFEVVNHGSAEGVAIGECALYDKEGPIGRSTVCALANRRMGPGPGPGGMPANGARGAAGN